MNRNATFTWSPDQATISLLNHFTLTVKDSGGNNLVTPMNFTANSTQTTVSLPVGTGYVATLTAYNSQGQPDANPPSVTFDVPAPPPTVPGDPTLNQPTIS